jgi:hypothetical protein
MNAPLATPALPDILEAADAAQRADLGWDVPVEVALFCTSSAFKAVVRGRYGRGHFPKCTARVFARGGRFFAIIYFPGHTDLLLPLDCHTLENRK